MYLAGHYKAAPKLNYGAATESNAETHAVLGKLMHILRQLG